MKNKVIATVAVMAIIVGFSAMNVSAWGWGNNYTMVPGMMNGGMHNSNISQELRDEVRAIQKEIITDQTELSALVAGGNPDPKRVRELSESIADKQLVLDDKYRTSGYGNGQHWTRNNMMGPGMMRGYMCNW
jgi:Spy/CpxP family protein refolding chaperone